MIIHGYFPRYHSLDCKWWTIHLRQSNRCSNSLYRPIYTRIKYHFLPNNDISCISYDSINETKWRVFSTLINPLSHLFSSSYSYAPLALWLYYSRFQNRACSVSGLLLVRHHLQNGIDILPASRVTSLCVTITQQPGLASLRHPHPLAPIFRHPSWLVAIGMLVARFRPLLVHCR